MNLTLRRIQSSLKGTLGELSVDGGKNILCFTLELPLMGDGKLAIQQTGDDPYNVVHYFSPHFKRMVFLVERVPNHSYVEIHAGNTIRDTHACILVGKELGEINGLPAVLHSVETLDKLLKDLPDNFKLTIVNP